MKSAERNILAINGGSSSIKFALFSADRALRAKVTGTMDRIGRSDAVFEVRASDGGENFTRPLAAEDHISAVATLMD